MRKLLLAIAVTLPALFAQAQNQPVQFRSLVDLGVCHGNSGVMRFLDGNRLKVQQDKLDLYAKDRNCSQMKRFGKNAYICGFDAWAIHQQTDWDMVVKVRLGQQNGVTIYNTSGDVIFESASCTPHNGHTLVY